ncbi:hypothetical protein PX699_27290 [Sphingobium sp. H39-3-25]|uniref:hypothetical protein n=1 Tax=Sphingobium arseniciresistens TaxID=3030834 RepID=UPI0023B889B5|nr:hypothetical protein [Sphingobium arseniciresistens]
MSVSDTIITTWLAAIARFRQARAAWLEWKSRNPYPTRDILPDDIEQQRAFLAEWELGSEGVGGPYTDAVDTLQSLPAPNLDAVIVKLQLVREALEGHTVEGELTPVLQLIERDLRRIRDDLEVSGKTTPN